MTRDQLIQRMADLLRRSKVEDADAVVELLELNLPQRLAPDRAALLRSRIDRELEGGSRIQAIKIHRELHGSDLRDAVAAVEARETALDGGAPAEPRYEDVPGSFDRRLDLLPVRQRAEIMARIRDRLQVSGVSDAAVLADALEVNLPVRLRTREDRVLAALRAGKALDAVVAWRERTGSSLADAKREVDRLKKSLAQSDNTP
jgi:ribosomal protein L7/L12